MFEEIYNKAFNDEIEKIALSTKTMLEASLEAMRKGGNYKYWRGHSTNSSRFYNSLAKIAPRINASRLQLEPKNLKNERVFRAGVKKALSSRKTTGVKFPEIFKDPKVSKQNLQYSPYIERSLR